MKFFLHLNIGFAIFFNVLFGSDINSLSQENPYLITSFDIQKHVDRAKETICKTVEEITTTSQDLSTFANTLRPWSRLLSQLSQSFAILKDIEQLDLPCSVEASRAFQDLQTIFSREVGQNSNLYNILNNTAEQAIRSPDSLERYIAGRFLENCPKDFLHLQGSSTEKQSEGFTILHLEERNFPTEGLSNLVEKIAAKDADIVCIQKIVSEEEMRTFYQLLQNRYAHFYLYMSPSALHLPKETSGLLVISKYPLEKLHFNQFAEVENGFFDFVITSGQTGIGHVYTAHLPSGKCEDIRATRLWQIIETLERDFLKETPMPFLLCGDLGVVRDSREAAETLLEGSFYSIESRSDTSYVLYFPPVPSFFNRPDWENTVITSVAPMLENYSGSLATVKGKWQNSMGISFAEKETPGEVSTVLCVEGEVYGKAGRDSNGNTELETGIKLRDDEGKWEAEGDGKVKRDKDGNITGEAELKVSRKF